MTQASSPGRPANQLQAQRLDIVTNDAGELVRREHARDLGAGVVIAVYRLAKLSQMHELTNQAFVRQLEETHALIQDYCLRAGINVNILFARKAIFVAGQLLKGNRGTWENALELADIFEWCGGAELSILREVSVQELRAFGEAISVAMRSEKGKGFRLSSPHIRLREVKESARLRGLDVENLPPQERIVRTYATAVVIMRRFFEDLHEGRYMLPRRVKRIAQSLVDLSAGSTAAFLGVTEARNANFDDAGRAVNTAILAVAMARQTTVDRAQLAQIAMSAIMHDVGRPRAAIIAASTGPQMTGVVARLSEEQEDKLPSGTAAVLTVLGRVNEATITRTVVAFEALWLRRLRFIGALYRGIRPPTLQAKIVSMARRYNDLLTPEPGLPPPTSDFAIGTIANEYREPSDRAILRMLVAALGIFPAGTVVQLATGEIGEVLTSPPERTASPDKPRVRIVMDSQGGLVEKHVEIDLAHPPKGPVRNIVRVVSVEGWKKALEGVGSANGMPSASGVRETYEGEESVGSVPSFASGVQALLDDEPAEHRQPPPSPPRAPQPVSAPPPIRDSQPAEAELHSSSVPSIGTSPSAVAEAFGKMMSEVPRSRPSAKPAHGERRSSSTSAPTSPVVPPAPRVPHDRTVAQSSPFDVLDRERQLAAAAAAARDPLNGLAPTARGTLAATPLVHVLVYMLDHALTGTVVFKEPDGAENVICFVGGAPAKARTQRPTAFLGDELVQAGVVGREVVNKAVESARKLGALLGEYLVENNLVTREAVAFALMVQLKRKVTSLVNLSPETTYAYFADVNGLQGFGGDDLMPCNPLDAILSCVRAWHDRARIHATLGRIGKQPLALHQDVNLAPVMLTSEEENVLVAIRGDQPSLQTLYQRRVADEEAISSLVYMLAVTRQLSFSAAKSPPMGGRSSSPAKRVSSPGQASSPSQAAVQSHGPLASRSSSTALSAVRPPNVPAPASSAPAVVMAPPVSRSHSPQSVPSARAPSEPPVDVDVDIDIDMGPSSHVPSSPPSANASSADDLPGDLADAEQALQAMTDFRLAESALQRNDLATAERMAQKAVDGDADQPSYAALLAWVKAMNGTPQVVQQSIEILSRVLKDDPGNERALLYRGKLHKRANHFKESLRDFSAILQQNPKHHEAASEARLLRSRAGK